MKVLTVVSNLEKGGTQRVAELFSLAYDKLGCDSRILGLNPGGSRLESLKKRVEVYQTIVESLGEIQNWDPDLVHIHASNVSESESINILIQNLKRSKFIETNVFSRPYPWRHKLVWSFQLSEWCLWLYRQRGGEVQHSKILPNLIDPSGFYQANAQEVNSFRKSYGIPQDAFLIGRIGQAYGGKWNPALLDIFEKLSDEISNVYLLIVNPSTEVLSLVKRSPYRNKVIHIPKIIGDESLKVAYSAIDVFAHITIQGESFGMVLIESMLCQTPVVTLQTPWADNSQGEVVERCKGGFVVHRLSSFKERLHYLYQNPELRNKLGEKGRKGVIENYDYLMVAKNALSFISTDFREHETKDPIEMLNTSHDSSRWFVKWVISSFNGRYKKLALLNLGRPGFNVIWQMLKKRLPI